jgi:UDP-N-acetylmuramate--alanine ligase
MQKKVFFSGICGSGMKPLAIIAAKQGYDVFGTDLNWDFQSPSLIRWGIAGRKEPDPERVTRADFYVYSSAIGSEHPERMAAGRAGIQILHRMDLLNMLVRPSRVRFAIAGTHGKTSSTSMAGWILLQAGLDPTIIAGGHPLYLEEGCRNGSGQVAVFETDESDGSFLKTEGGYRLILNVDRDHLNYYGSFDRLREAFYDFAAASASVIYAADSQLAEICKDLKPMAAFGPAAGIYHTSLICKGRYYSGQFSSDDDLNDDALSVNLLLEGQPWHAQELKEASIHLSVPGRHFAMNALGVIALIHSAIYRESVLQRRFDPDDPKTLVEMIEILNDFPGVERRLEHIGTVHGIPVYDDYGHHPTEIRAVIDALHRRGARPLSVVFQPHRYTRTAELAVEFARALEAAEHVYLLPIYSAGETPIEGVSSQKIADLLQADLIEESSFDCIFEENPAAVLFLGAGSVSAMAREYVDRFKNADSVF